MTLDEAIKKYTDMAYAALERANTPKAPGDWAGLMSVSDDLDKACEYEELAEWLKELKERREKDNDKDC